MIVRIMRLFHFSEDAGFRGSSQDPSQSRPEVEPLVWVVDEPHA
jgi:hypothetical protein